MSEEEKESTAINSVLLTFPDSNAVMPGDTATIMIPNGQAFEKALNEAQGEVFISFMTEEGRRLPVGAMGVAMIKGHLPDGGVQATIDIEGRGRLVNFEDSIFGELKAIPVQPIPLPDTIDPELIDLIMATVETVKEVIKTVPVAAEVKEGLAATIMMLADDPFEFADELVSWFQNTGIAEFGASVQQRLLQTTDPGERLEFLHETIKANYAQIAANAENEEEEINQLERKIHEAGMPEEALKKCEKELKKLRGMNPMDPTSSKVHEWLDYMVSYPWNVSSETNHDLQTSEDILNADHYGLEKVKERILEQLAVQQQTGKVNGSIICLVGPPGVGKTSIGKSIAHATGRAFERLSLGGVHDEGTIRGFKTTYVGAVPGRIMELLARVGTNNPVIQLDEIDKLGKHGANGDPAAALLEVLDPAQNNSFVDQYLGVKFDLSNVLFVCSANDLSDIPGPLRDRMEIIEIEGYTDEEKVEIGKRYLVGKAMEDSGLAESQFSITDPALVNLIDGYTSEAGVRSLEREIKNLTRKTVRQIQQSQATSVTVTPDNLTEYAGPIKVLRDEVDPEPRVGRVNGLYVSGMGGGLLPFEAVMFADPKGGAMATGSLQDVMKESVSDAYDFIRSHAAELGITPATYQNNTLHVKAGDGATPKDGPSAGLAMAALMTSVLTGIPLRGDLAMTGEIGLSGKAMPIGGVKQKLLGAHRAGAKTVLIPVANVKDLEDVPQKVKDALEIIPVANVMEVLQHALVRMPQPLSPEQIAEATATAASDPTLVASLTEVFERVRQLPANDTGSPAQDEQSRGRFRLPRRRGGPTGPT